VIAAEQRAGVRPRRRPELVTQRIEALQPTLQRLEAVCQRQTATLTDLQAKRTEWLGQRYALEHQVQKTPDLAQKERVSKQILTLGQRLDKLPTQLAQRQAVLARSRERWQKALAEQADLQAWRIQL
jgi:flagellar biosynthesis chaperone FliJ